MARNFLKVLLCRSTSQYVFAQYRNLSSDTKMVTDIKKSVFISGSHNIFTNLALENWFYKNFDFSTHNILMLWQNDPCVVIGRHQNPWLETKMSTLSEQNIPLARRNSGGGTVYQDRGNLNLTFFTSRKDYNRKNNLELISRALFKEFGLTAVISSKQDLTFEDGMKISGTAAKLGTPNSYHHCTLLVNIDKLKLNEVLQQEKVTIQTNAVKSIYQPVKNLCEEVPGINLNSLMDAVGYEYLRTNALITEENSIKQKEIKCVYPTDHQFPGLSAIRDEFLSWDWCYGKTPEFSIDRFYSVPQDQLAGADSSNQELKLTIHVKQGRIDNIVLNNSLAIKTTKLQGDTNVITTLKGSEFNEEAMTTLESALAVNNISTDKMYKSESIPIRQVSEKKGML